MGYEGKRSSNSRKVALTFAEDPLQLTHAVHPPRILGRVSVER